MKNMGPHCTVRPRAVAVASGLDITTLEPNKIFTVTITISTLQLLDGLAHSPSEAVPLVLKHCLQVASWWHFGSRLYESFFTTP